MRRFRTGIAVMLAAALCAGCLCGLNACRKQDGGEDGEANETVTDGAGILTHVFRPSYFPLPEGYSFDSSVTPRWDEERDALTFLATYRNSWEDENGEWQSEQRTQIVTASADGILSEEEFPLAENEYFSNGVFTETGIVWLTSSYDQAQDRETYLLYAETFGEDGQASCDDVQSLFENVGQRGWFFVERLAADGEGNVYLTSEQEIVVLTPELKKICSITLPSYASTLAADGEGRVWVTGYFGNGQAMCAVDPEARTLGDPVALPEGVNELFFGPGHDIYYRSENGLCAADRGTDGKIGEGELLFDFLNSDISRETASIVAVYGPEAVLMSERGENGSAAALYRHAPDVDLSQITVLRLAYTQQLDYMTPARIVEFNKAHADVRIVTDDCSAGDPDDYYGGENRLVTEMLTGTYRPDIVAASQSGPALAQIVKHGLFADLGPFTEREGLLNADNIMGCVKRTFTDGEGRLFALAPAFTLSTLVSTPELLGPYAERGHWTVEEMLDYAGSLPADRVLMENLTRENAPDLLLGQEGYASFLSADGKACSFDSDLFVRYLDFLASLPTWEEYAANDPFAGVDPEEKYTVYLDGKIALKTKYIRHLVGFLSLELDFGTKDWVLIGRPTGGDRGNAISASSVYVVTAEGERAEAAWEVLETLFQPNEYMFDNGIPALVSEFEELVEQYYTYDFALTYSGGASWGTKDPDRPRELRSPGILTEFTEEDERRIRDALENRCGVPYSPGAEADVTEIVKEEISAFLGGAGSAKDCAEKIQSRVSILLSERG